MASRIEDYALVGDMESAALVGRNGSIDWLCVPRFDSPAIFAALVGSADNGHWIIAPVGAGDATRRRYRPDTLILEQEWDTADGRLRLLDFMPARDKAPNLVRIVTCLSGEVAVRSVLRLRFDYGRVLPWVTHRDGHLSAVAGPDAVNITSTVPLHGRDFATQSEVTLQAGQSASFVLTWHPSYEPEPSPVEPDEALAQTEQFWKDWVARSTYEGPYREAVVRSLITLKALTFEPTGGLVAAPTTSLPEDLGGTRNWDYRFCWLRDASLTLRALIATGHTEEAEAWRGWLLRAIAGDPADLQIMYGLAGERRLPEWSPEWLVGYEGSTPVRIGNDAAVQRQLDVYGEVLDTLDLAGAAGLSSDAATWAIQVALLDWLEQHWQEPDEGLWEVRGPRRQFVHSKVLAWVAFDRAARMAHALGHAQHAARWSRVRDEIHEEVCQKGYDADRGTFTQYYGSAGLDAATLLIPMLGFLPGDDPRVLGTIAAVEATLAVDGFVLRYDTHGSVDGLPGHEGAFLACSFWLATALHQSGRTAEATALFERLLGLCNDVGLLSEEYDPRYQRLVGNFPQAFSHIGLLNTAITLAHPPGQAPFLVRHQRGTRKGDPRPR
ncbi:MAG TPA: glycoside hydrolase family 15 protein [Actinomycetes bacterium]|nr:glycoside hydrolase family 15 protein [Actinomycetes bacterium]